MEKPDITTDEIKHAELIRLKQEEDRAEGANWKQWGPYLSERQWGTVREDYSHDGAPWSSFPHDHARGRAYSVGGKTDCWESPIVSADSASPSRYGMGVTRF